MMIFLQQHLTQNQQFSLIAFEVVDSVLDAHIEKFIVGENLISQQQNLIDDVVEHGDISNR